MDVRGQPLGAGSLLLPQGPGERTLVIVPGGKCIFGSSLTFIGSVGVGFSSSGGPA